MAQTDLEYEARFLANVFPDTLGRRSAESRESELSRYKASNSRLRVALARDRALLHDKDDVIELQKLLRRESDHRMLNDLQSVVSLLSMQSRASANLELAAQLSVAANRVATIERLHRSLHSVDGEQTVAFREYLESICHDFSAIMSLPDDAEQTVAFESIDVVLPTATAIPLGYIVNELMMNASKYGSGHIEVQLEGSPRTGYVLSVSNDGPSLPQGFDPATGKGLGMKIIRSFVRQIGGKLQFGSRDDGQGARFEVRFS